MFGFFLRGKMSKKAEFLHPKIRSSYVMISQAQVLSCRRTQASMLPHPPPRCVGHGSHNPGGGFLVAETRRVKVASPPGNDGTCKDPRTEMKRTYTCRISTLSPIIMEVENGPKFLNETKFSYRDPFWTSLIIGGRVRSKMWCFVWWLHDAHTMYHPKTNLPAAHIKFEPSIPP